jgi:hypothetical protein
MKLTFIRIPDTHFQDLKTHIVFRHNWKGRELFWIVPMIYVVKYDFKDGFWTVRLSEAYFQTSVNGLAA